MRPPTLWVSTTTPARAPFFREGNYYVYDPTNPAARAATFADWYAGYGVYGVKTLWLDAAGRARALLVFRRLDSYFLAIARAQSRSAEATITLANSASRWARIQKSGWRGYSSTCGPSQRAWRRSTFRLKTTLFYRVAPGQVHGSTRLRCGEFGLGERFRAIRERGYMKSRRSGDIQSSFEELAIQVTVLQGWLLTLDGFMRSAEYLRSSNPAGVMMSGVQLWTTG